MIMAELNRTIAYPTRLVRTQTLIYFASFIALGFITSALGPALPYLAENTRSSLSAISYLFLVRSLGYFLGSLYSGRAFDRLAGHLLLAGVLTLCAVMSALIPVIPVLWVLILVLFVLGAAESALDVGVNLMLIWVQRERSDPYLNALHFFFGVGAFLMPMIIAQSILVSGYINWAFWILAVYPLVLAAWSLRVPSPAAYKQEGELVEADAKPFFIVLIAALFFLYVGAEVSYGGWIFTYTTTLGLGDERTAAYLTSAFWGALTVGRLVAIPIASRLRPRTFLYCDLFGCLLSLSLIILLPQSYLAIWVGTIGLGFSMASFFPTLLAYAANRMVVRGSITRWFFVGSGAGGMILPWMIGQLFEPLGPQVVLYAILINILLALVVFVYSNTFERIAQPAG